MIGLVNDIWTAAEMVESVQTERIETSETEGEGVGWTLLSPNYCMMHKKSYF